MMSRARLDLDVRVPMRDGATLNTEVWRPEAPDPVPAILIRSPYPDPVARATLDPPRAVRMGFAVLVQQVRGTGASDGDFEPWLAEPTDGPDTVAWCAAQPWCNGAVATMGLSYLAHAQLFTAGEQPAALRAMVLEVVPDDAYALTYVGGALALGSAMGWSVGQAANSIMRRGARGEDVGVELGLLIDTLHGEPDFRRRPLRGVELLRQLFPSWQDWLDHPLRDDWWAARACKPAPPLPALCVGGWYDLFLAGTLATWRRFSEVPQSRLLIGPWGHGGRTSALGELNFGPGANPASVDLMGQELEFLAGQLQPGSARPSATAPVRVFVMGANQWRDLDAWPPATAVATDFYLHAGGGLSRTPPSQGAPPQTYTFDPADPVPTIGGANLFSDSEAAYQTGPWDQSALAGRRDILSFVSEPLVEPLEVIGKLSVTLWAASSARDTDWTAKLIDVWPDGRAINIADGIIRARHRASVERSELPTPEQVHEYTIDLVATALWLAPGHRLRVDISSSNFPRFDVNPGTGELMADADPATYLTARQRVYVDAEHPSRLTLPLL